MKPIKYKLFRASYKVQYTIPRIGAYHIIYPDGTQSWRVDGKLHRIGKPAVIFRYAPDTNPPKWFLYGKEYDKQQYWIEVAKLGYDVTKNAEAITALI